MSTLRSPFGTRQAAPLSTAPKVEVDFDAEDAHEEASRKALTMLRAAKKDGQLAQGLVAVRKAGDGIVIGNVEAKIQAVAESTGLTRAEVLAEMGVKEVTRSRPVRATRKKHLEHAQAGEAGDFSSDDPSSPHYRFRDTGYVPGSRKEMAALYIRTEAKEGRQIKADSIEWEAIEQNPREAKALITKSNLFGTVDWEALKGGGMTPGAGFLVDRVYAAVGKEPSEDSPRARKDYAIGLETLRSRLEVCKTHDEVGKALEALLEESEGHTFLPEEADAIEKIKAERSILWGEDRAYRDEERRLDNAYNAIKNEVDSLEWEQTKRTRRGWKPSPEVSERMAKLKPGLDEAHAVRMAWRDANPNQQSVSFNVGGKTGYGSVNERKLTELRNRKLAIEAFASLRNKAENPLCRAWSLMGERFEGVLAFRTHKGSDAFQKHFATAKAGKIKDWSWAETDVIRVATSTKESVRFQLKVADTFDRIGGTPVHVESSVDLKRNFGLREAEYGLWVAEDFNSAKFHTERSAEAFADLADLIGVRHHEIALQGQLAVGFGSRGQGAIGWRTTAPAATYFPRNRVMNFTKHAGGGSLGHEWFHGLDNILAELVTGQPTGENFYSTENIEKFQPGPLKSALDRFVRAMTEGNVRIHEKVTYTGADLIKIRSQMNREFRPTTHPGSAQIIKESGNLDQAVLALKERFSHQRDRNGALKRQAKIDMKYWITLAAAYFEGKEDGGTVITKTGEPTSRFLMEAHRLDGDKALYWSTTRELAARSFSAWCEDRLRDQGRLSDYLSWHADNKFYQDPMFGNAYPFPEGEERIRINEALDNLIQVVRETGVLTRKDG